MLAMLASRAPAITLRVEAGEEGLVFCQGLSFRGAQTLPENVAVDRYISAYIFKFLLCGDRYSAVDRWIAATTLIGLGMWTLSDYRRRVMLRGQKRFMPDWASKAHNVGVGLFCLVAGIAIAVFGHAPKH